MKLATPTVLFLVLATSASNLVSAPGSLPPYKDPQVTSIQKEPYRATFTPYANVPDALGSTGDSSRVFNLNGIREFKLINGKANVPTGYGSKDFNTADWDEIPVPSNWQRHGYGLPIYSNSRLNTEPDEVGLYRRTFALPERLV